uniref:Uncharacterized protein n=1 Tax=Pectinophora gossypiella TaxID=13191 RepID=A0A1E1WQ55_PECGO
MLASPAMEMQNEETPLALQRLWNLTRARLAGTSTALDDEPALVETLPSAQEPEGTPKSFVAIPSDYESDGEEAFPELEVPELPEPAYKSYWAESISEKEVLLDASTLGDVPAVYRVPAPAPHQMPVIGVYIDPRVRTGFRYKVRPMQVRRVI